MLIKKKFTVPRTRKLSFIILEYLFLSAITGLFTFLFLYTMTISIGETYLENRNIILSGSQNMVFHIWLRSLCGIGSVLIFIFLFLFMLGQRLSYLLTITKGIDKLRENRMDFDIPLEGNDDLTLLAESINYLSASQREIDLKEKRMNEERDAWIRALSHDIRTPLTSMLSYSELMMNKETVTAKEARSYAELIYNKSLQIRQLTTQLMDRKGGTWENIPDIRLLMEQLAGEWEEILEERFSCTADLSGCRNFPGSADVHALRRIMDNLTSNTEKYAALSSPVHLLIRTEERTVIITQENEKIGEHTVPPESHRIGLMNIRQIASFFDGDVNIEDSETTFRITIRLKIPHPVES